MSSFDLAHWSKRWHYLERGPRWAKGGASALPGAPGAPVLRDDGRWVMTFQAEAADCTRPVCTCIGSAVSAHPSQPFIPTDAPLTCMPGNDGAIDSSPRWHVTFPPDFHHFDCV